MFIQRPSPVSPEAPESQPATLPLVAMRAPDERQVLLKGAITTLLIGVVGLAVFLTLALRLPALVGWIVFGVAAVWLIGPYAWLAMRRRALLLAHRAQLAQASTPQVPQGRAHPQALVDDLCRRMGLTPPTLALVPGAPGITSLPGAILVTEELYALTNDRDLQWLLLHELGHHLFGHVTLQPLAEAVPPPETEGIVRIAMLPILPLVLGLEEWALWADVSADRLALVVHPNLNLAVMSTLKQGVLTAPDSARRAHLVRFLASRDTVDHSEEAMLNHDVNEFLRQRPDMEARIANLRAWQRQELFAAFQAQMSESSPAPDPAHLTLGETTMPLRKLAELGLTLPPAPKPIGIYVPAVRTGNLIFLCGQLPLVDGKLPLAYTGKLGTDVTLEHGAGAARQAALNSLAILHEAAGGLQHVTRIVRLTGYVSSHPTFTQQPQVLNGASELLAAVFGEAGAHARVAIGVAALPLDACIEVDIIAEVADTTR